MKNNYEIIKALIDEISQFDFEFDDFSNIYFTRLNLKFIDYPEYVYRTIESIRSHIFYFANYVHPNIEDDFLQKTYTLIKNLTQTSIDLKDYEYVLEEYSKDDDTGSTYFYPTPNQNYELQEAFKFYLKINEKLLEICNIAISIAGLNVKDTILTGPFKIRITRKNKFRTILSGDQLAYLFFLLKESNIISTRINKEIAEMISNNFTSTDQSSFSIDSIANKMNNAISDADKDEVKKVLEELILKIKKK
ncbi:MAG: hypothetical protein IPO16_07300 [Saprospiraceae bacterium]|nr:hypothetical protein [Saprospiraceae bacterium]